MSHSPGLLDIRTVQKLTGLTARAIRFYDENGLVRPHRTPLNRRAFDHAGVERLRLIALLRRGGVSLIDIRCILTLRESAPHEPRAATVALRSLDSEAQRLREQLKAIGVVSELVAQYLAPVRWAAE